MTTVVKIINALALLFTGCAHDAAREKAPAAELQHQGKVSAAELRRHVVGTWWCDHYSVDGPFYLVTFHPDGRWTCVSTNAPGESAREAYWRVTTDGLLLVTKTRGALPSSNLEMFEPDSITDRRMVFSQPSTAGGITFSK